MKRKGMIVLVLKRMKAIACVDMNWAIGKDNKLLFHIPEDMKFFKKMTTNNVVIMGNNTLKSMGKALPNRINVVLTSSIKGMMFVTPELIMTDAIAIEDYINSVIENTNKDIYIIGGESIYKRYLKRCSELYLTEVFTTVENADAHFPPEDTYTSHLGYTKLISEGYHDCIKYRIHHYTDNYQEEYF